MQKASFRMLRLAALIERLSNGVAYVADCMYYGTIPPEKGRDRLLKDMGVEMFDA